MPTSAASSRAGVNVARFIAYKALNSVFLGLSIGTVFILYTPLSPKIFSAGGIGLALATLVIASQYQRLFTVDWFYRSSLLVELIILSGIVGVLIYPVETPLALFIYVGYQITFAFGSYLVRCETLLLVEHKKLATLDAAKQAGYLLGMALSWGIYELMEQRFAIQEQVTQVVWMHWPLLLVQLGTIALLLWAFRHRDGQRLLSAGAVN